MGLPVTFRATPFHICPVLEYKGRKVWVELTMPKGGFDIDPNTEKSITVLLENKLVTTQEVESKGREAVLEEVFHGHYLKSPASVLAYHYYNQALALDGMGKKEESFWALAKACTLEHEDDFIQKVFDASFAEISVLPKWNTPYSRAATCYFSLRGKDSAAVLDALTNVTAGIQNLIVTERDAAQADSILAMLGGTIIVSPRTEKQLAELSETIVVSHAIDLSRRGLHESAFAIVSSELEKDSSNARLKDIYVDVGLAYVERLFTSGKEDLAADIADSIHRKLPDYAKVRDEYIRLLVQNVMTTGAYRTSPRKSRETLLKAFAVDSTNILLRKSLGYVCHEVAMDEIRKSNWRSARGEIVRGLRFAPDSEFLKSDLELLNKEQPKSKK